MCFVSLSVRLQAELCVVLCVCVCVFLVYLSIFIISLCVFLDSKQANSTFFVECVVCEFSTEYEPTGSLLSFQFRFWRTVREEQTALCCEIACILAVGLYF